MGSSAVRGSWILAFAGSSASLAFAQKTPDVRLDVGDSPGASESAPVALASSGTSVFVAYLDGRNGLPSAQEVFFNRSLDGGLSWLAPDVRLDNPGVAFGARNAVIASESSSVYVAWSDERDGDGDVYFNRSLDAGSTWFPAAVRIDLGDAPGENYSDVPAIASLGSSVYAVWVEEREPPGIYVNRSLDRGDTWLPAAVHVSSGYPCESRLDLAAAGSAVHVVWADCGLNQIFYNRSENAGLTWLPTSTRIDHALSGYDGGAQIAACGSNVYVVWVDGRNGIGGDVYFNRSLDGGTTWLDADLQLSPGSDCQVVAAGSAVYVVWESGSKILFNRSLDAGTTWLPSAVRLDVGSGQAPQIALSGDGVYVTWWDGRNGGSDVYFNRSLDQGSNWLPTDVRIDTGDMPGASDSYNPQIAVSGSSAYVAWYDGRDGEFDIYFNLAGGYQTYEEGTPGSGGIVPAISGSGNASIGGTASVDVANGLGGAVCALVYSFDGPAALPSKYGTLLLQPPWSSRAVTLGGASGVPGAGSVSVSAAVPNDPAVLGLRLNFQAGILDPSALGGIALSGGLELWVL